MNKRQIREFMTIRAASLFLRDKRLRAPHFRAIAATLDDVIERIEALDVAAHLAATRANGKMTRQLSDDLRHMHMIPLARRGKTIFRGEVEIENALRVPHARAQPAVVVAAAEAMIKTIAPHRALFLQAGLPKSFLTDLRNASTRLRTFVKAADKQRESSPDVFVELRRQIARGRQEVSVADGLILGWLRTRPTAEGKVLATRWRAAHRIKARMGRPAKRGSGSGDCHDEPQPSD